MKRAHILVLILLAAPLFVVPGAAVVASSPAGPDERYARTTWDDLIPPGWDPGQVFDSLNFAEMADNDPRVELALKKFKKMWDEAPTNPALKGREIQISGFVASLDFTGQEELKEFLLVPYFGACIHVPPPPANQIIHVTVKEPRKGIRSMDVVTVRGRLALEKTEADMG
ncbi:MAG: DUF3299 domain-containing protein, partial [Candidatus Adiutrix sp.]|nr:DUF3299 domain-containing protein [Candidatus Adiutrix sp.]